MATKTPPALTEFTKTITLKPSTYKVQMIVTSDVNQSILNRTSVVGEHERDPNIVAMNCEDTRGKGRSYLFLPFKISPGDIAHEAYHSVCSMFRWIGAESEEELHAYHLTHVVDTAHKHIAASIKKRDKPRGNDELRQTVLENSLP